MRTSLFPLLKRATAGLVAILVFAGSAAFAQVLPTVPTQATIGQPLSEQAPALIAYPQPAGGADKGIDQKAFKALVEDAVSAELKKRDEQKKAEEAAAKTKLEDEGYRIGSDMKISASFKDGLFLWLETPNKDFSMHIGGWMQYDNVFWTQSSLLRLAPDGRPGAKQGVASGAAMNGIGDLEDGTYFRRIRPFVEGTMWENYEYRLILFMENIQFSTVGLDEFWVAANNVPFLGTVRVGHVKTPMGFEADMTGSSRTMTFMERSSYSEAMELNQNFVTGIWFSNNCLDERTTATFAAFRQDQGVSSGAFYGDGQWGWQGRLTALPLYECDGRHLLHVGLSGGWRNGTSNLATSSDRTFELRARPGLRDDDAAGSPAGAQVIPNADSNRMIDTGVIVAGREWLTGLEMLYVHGPFSLQAEYGFNWIDDAIGFAPAGFVLTPKLTSPQNYVFSGGYVQVAYTLTGENRGYDKKYGILSRDYFGGKGPYTNAWLVRDEDGRLNCGLGAWELAARYSYVNLNDGAGLNRIQGGVMGSWAAGLNWYLNSNVKCQFEWAYDQRTNVPIGTIPGYTMGFGTRVQLSF